MPPVVLMNLRCFFSASSSLCCCSSGSPSALAFGPLFFSKLDCFSTVCAKAFDPRMGRKLFYRSLTLPPAILT